MTHLWRDNKQDSIDAKATASRLQLHLSREQERERRTLLTCLNYVIVAIIFCQEETNLLLQLLIFLLPVFMLMLQQQSVFFHHQAHGLFGSSSASSMRRQSFLFTLLVPSSMKRAYFDLCTRTVVLFVLYRLLKVRQTVASVYVNCGL